MNMCLEDDLNDREAMEVIELETCASDAKLLRNTNGVLQKIANLYAERLMSDVTLAVGQNRYPAHRIILCASSDVFQVMLMNATWREFGDAVITLQEDEKCHDVFPEFLRYMYLGKMSITVDKAVYILKLADKYNIHDLVKLCIEYMKQHVNAATSKGHFVEWLHNAMLICPHRKDLIIPLENYLKWNLERVVLHPGWENLSLEVMHWLVQQNDLVIRSELRLYELIEYWFLHQKALIESDSSERDCERTIDNLVNGVLMQMRFSMMSLPQMADVLMSSSVSVLKEFVVARVADGMNFHSQQLEMVNAIRQSRSGELLFTPRMYTSDLWSLVITVDYFKKVGKYASVASFFFSPTNFSEVDDENIGWDVEFFPLGVRYEPAQLIGIYSASTNREIPESIIRTVRLRITCRTLLRGESRYLIGVLIYGMMNGEEYVQNCHMDVAYFSNEHRVKNINNLIPYEHLELGGESLNHYLLGELRNKLRITVVIVPLNPFSNPFPE